MPDYFLPWLTEGSQLEIQDFKAHQWTLLNHFTIRNDLTAQMAVFEGVEGHLNCRRLR